jgi:hypothetical protein
VGYVPCLTYRTYVVLASIYGRHGPDIHILKIHVPQSQVGVFIPPKTSTEPAQILKRAYFLYNENHIKMKEAIVKKGTQVEIVDSPIPRPGKDQVVIKVIVSGSNPKDW